MELPSTVVSTSLPIHFISPPKPRLSWAALCVPLVFFALAAAAIALCDVPLARAGLRERLPSFLVSAAHHGEVFGNGVGVLYFFAAVWLLDPARRRMLPRLICATYGSGLAANVFKLCIARSRPFQWLKTGGGLADQFGAPFGFAGRGSAWQSFPSAHTATAVGLALGLSILYPRGAKLFALLAMLVALQRVVSDMHYLSDTLFAAGIAWLVCLAIYRHPAAVRFFEKIERPRHAEATADAGRRAA